MTTRKNNKNKTVTHWNVGTDKLERYACGESDEDESGKNTSTKDYDNVDCKKCLKKMNSAKWRNANRPLLSKPSITMRKGKQKIIINPAVQNMWEEKGWVADGEKSNKESNKEVKRTTVTKEQKMNTIKKGSLVNALSKDGELYEAVVEKVMSNGDVCRVRYNEEETEIVNVNDCQLRKSPKQQTNKDNDQEIKDLLDELETATDTADKKRIRAALRRRGHRGGLSKSNTVAV